MTKIYEIPIRIMNSEFSENMTLFNVNHDFFYNTFGIRFLMEEYNSNLIRIEFLFNSDNLEFCYHFEVLDERKAMLFFIKYSDYIAFVFDTNAS